MIESKEEDQEMSPDRVITKLAGIVKIPADAGEKRFNFFIDEHPEGIVMLRARMGEKGKLSDFTYIYINRTAETMLRMKKQDMLGHTVLHFFPSTESEGIFNIYKTVYETGRPTVLQFQYKHEGFNNWFRQKIERFEDGILVRTTDLDREERGS
jgi:PAS domain-containing protein